MRIAFGEPSGLKRGSRKHVSPALACASTRKASHIGAEKNHLCPVMRNASPSGSARVVLARTSLPPCFSVMPMPSVTLFFSDAGRNEGSYSRERMRGSHSATSAGSAISAPVAA